MCRRACASRLGLHDVVAQHVRLPGDVGSNPGKAATVVAGMVTGADSIEDVDLVRDGGMPALFEQVYAPSTVGSFLRTFTHGHVRQLDAAAREMVTRRAGLPRCVWAHPPLTGAAIPPPNVFRRWADRKPSCGER
jgi:hypothetical protein